MGSTYPMLLKFVKNGAKTKTSHKSTTDYPFMIGVAVCVKNLIMLWYYASRWITSSNIVSTPNNIDCKSHKTYTKLQAQDLSDESTSTGNSFTQSLHRNQPNYLLQFSALLQCCRLRNNHVVELEMKMQRQSQTLQDESIVNLGNMDHIDMIRISPANMHEEIYAITSNSTSCTVDASQQVQTHENVTVSANININHRTPFEQFKLYLYLAPNALLVLANDVLALHTISLVNVTTYAVLMQISLAFIVLVRYLFLKKSIYRSQILSVTISIIAMILFKCTDLDKSRMNSTSKHQVGSDIIGIGLIILRGIIKASDLVYVEWFIHHVKELPFYEKQTVVSTWFVLCSIIYAIIYNGNDIFVEKRPLFDGFSLITWVFVIYGTLFAMLIYLLILRLDAMVMGFCQQLTVLFAMFFDVTIFKTNVSTSMWLSAFIVIVSILEYSLIQEDIKNETKWYKRKYKNKLRDMTIDIDDQTNLTLPNVTKSAPIERKSVHIVPEVMLARNNQKHRNVMDQV